MNIAELTLQYYQARTDHELADEAKKKAYKKMKAMESELIDKMLDDHEMSVKRDDGTTVSVKSETQIGITLGNTDAIRDWLTEAHGDDADFVKPALQRKEVLAYVRQLLEEGTPEDELPEFLNLNTRPVISVRGWKQYQATLGKL